MAWGAAWTLTNQQGYKLLTSVNRVDLKRLKKTKKIILNIGAVVVSSFSDQNLLVFKSEIKPVEQKFTTWKDAGERQDCMGK